MISKKIYIIVGLLILISSGILICMNYYKQTNVDFEFVKKVSLDSLPKEKMTFIISSNIEELTLCLNKRISSDEINKLRLSTLDFVKFDYLLSFKVGIERISHSNYYSHKHDFCSYTKEIPVELHNNNDTCDTCVYIYKLKDKHKYRHLCP